MFDGVSRRYDLFNDILSMGLDRWWRRQAVRTLSSPPGARVLDLGCGTGKLGALLASRCHVVGIDLSQEMLRLAQRTHGSRLRYVQGSAFRLPFGSGSFDAGVSGFVLRNLEDLPAAFAELSRVLRPRAPIAVVDITEPSHPLFRRLFDAYFRTVAPALGALAGKAGAYRYLVGSLGQIPPPEDVMDMLSAAGFARAAARPLTGGLVTLFTAARE
jgi:demethylmenaquinone methyltransferase/2-methoxy-6-polyprenyl-1,4-benzoquinol methylase